MTHDDAIVRPVRTKNTPAMGPLVLLAATGPDVQILRRELDLTYSRPLYMSRLYYKPADLTQPAVVGPIIGAPYAVMLLEILRAWGVQKAFFVGWCGSIDPGIRIGDIIVPSGAWIDEGTSVHYGQSAGGPVLPDKALSETIQNGLDQRRTAYSRGLIWTTDAIFRETRTQIHRFQQLSALAVEMEFSALLSAAAFYGFPLAGILTVSDELFTFQWRPGFKNELFNQSRLEACTLLIELSKKMHGS